MKAALGTSTLPFPLAQEGSFEANLPTVLTDHTHPFCQAPSGLATCSQNRLSPALKLTQKTYSGDTLLPAGRQPWGPDTVRPNKAPNTVATLLLLLCRQLTETRPRNTPGGSARGTGRFPAKR